MNIHFSNSEKIELLIKNGYSVKYEAVTWTENEYHNHVSEKVIMAWVVYENNERADLGNSRPSEYGFVNEAFQNMVKCKLIAVLA